MTGSVLFYGKTDDLRTIKKERKSRDAGFTPAGVR